MASVVLCTRMYLHMSLGMHQLGYHRIRILPAYTSMTAVHYTHHIYAHLTKVHHTYLCLLAVSIHTIYRRRRGIRQPCT